jgi:hypothetical protein
MRKVYVEVKVKLIINMDDGVEVQEVVNELDYSFNSQTDGATIEDTEILDHEVKDSK